MKTTLTAILLVLFAFSANANEPHSPQYKCQSDTGSIHYLLIGNEFPQIPDLDWSSEIYMATGDQYFNDGYKQNILYTIADDEIDKTLAINMEDASQLIILDKDLNLIVQDGEKVELYNCIVQKYVD